MSVPLNQEAKGEGALIVFTTCVPASWGLSLTALIFGGGEAPAFLAIALASVGMVGSVTHLAKPLRAPTSLRNLKTSWLSREIAAVSVFWAFLALWAMGEMAGLPFASLAGRTFAVISGALLLWVIARAYKVSTRPAWMGHECLVELVACGLGAGNAAFGACTLEAIGCLWVPGVVFATAGLVLDVYSHKNRRARLASLRGDYDERIQLTLESYDRLWGKVQVLWAIETVAVVVSAATLWWPAAALQLVAHGMHRQIFYDLPVQVRYVARLRK